MNFTGERVIPGQVDPDLFNEHRARYLLARRYAAGQTVLDAACGTGYGTALLAEVARFAVGVDIAGEAVAYARQNYASQHTAFLQADCFALPFPSAHFDLVAAFEIIEHVGDAAGFLAELRRMLRPGGLLLLSTPNRLYYTEDRAEVNPFHVREFSYAEFRELLGAHFRHWSILFENHVPGVMLAEPGSEQQITARPGACLRIENRKPPASAEQAGREAHYMLAICSDQPPPEPLPLLYLPASGNVLRQRELHIRELERHLAEARTQFHEMERRLLGELAECQRWAKALDQSLAEKDAYILRLQADYDQKVEWARSLEQDVAKARRELERLQQEFEERTAWALRLNRELQFLRGTRWYRMGQRLRLELEPPAEGD